MNDFNTFIVTSTINAIMQERINVYDSKIRFEQTLETFKSIRQKVKNSKIIFIDNSLIPLTKEQKDQILPFVDYFEQIEHNLFTSFCNNIGSKGLGEIYMMERALNIIETHNLIGKRIFKITGRYRLADSFDINFYDSPDLYFKYAHKVNQWDVSLDHFTNHIERVVYFETRFWSFCYTLLEEYKKILKIIFRIMIENYGKPMCNLEMCHWKIIPHGKLYELEQAHVEGYTADNGLYKFE